MHTRPPYTTLFAIVLTAFAAGAFTSMHLETYATNLDEPATMPEGLDMSPVWRAWSLLEDKFVPATSTDTLTEEDRVWGIIEGLAASYDDPYTVFMPPAESSKFEQDISGSFGGVGMELGMRDHILTVIAPLKGTPAEEAGIRAGDLVIEVDGASTKDMSIDEAVARIRGEVGTNVTFKIAREDEAEFLTITVTRDTIEIPTLDHSLRDDGIYVISLYNFGGSAMGEMRDALRSFITSRSKKLILDLRGNPGGYLDAAVEMASFFLPAGKVVVTEDYGSKDEPRIHRSKGYDIGPSGLQMVVLTDGGSASASEILAGALREHDRAVLIGEQTFGKGSVQELIEVTPETSLKVTVARWLTPDGNSISASGLTPDLIVPFEREDADAGRDPQLEAAVHYLKTGVLEAPENRATSSPEELKIEEN